MFQFFAPSFKKEKEDLLFKTLDYFGANSRMILFFSALFFSSTKNIHHRYNQQIYIYMWFFFHSLYLSLSSMFS